jgi:hypothetical protein
LYSDALDRAQATLRHVDGTIAPYVPDLALVELDTGDDAAAAQLLESDISTQVAQGDPSPNLATELSLWAQRLGTGPGYACQLREARHLLPTDGGSDGLPAATSACPARDQGSA